MNLWLPPLGRSNEAPSAVFVCTIDILCRTERDEHFLLNGHKPKILVFFSKSFLLDERSNIICFYRCFSPRSAGESTHIFI